MIGSKEVTSEVSQLNDEYLIFSYSRLLYYAPFD